MMAWLQPVLGKLPFIKSWHLTKITETSCDCIATLPSGLHGHWNLWAVEHCRNKNHYWSSWLSGSFYNYTIKARWPIYSMPFYEPVPLFFISGVTSHCWLWYLSIGLCYFIPYVNIWWPTKVGNQWRPYCSTGEGLFFDRQEHIGLNQ